MFKNFLLLKNEEGSAMLVALMILMVLTIIGVSSSNTTTVELQIVRNDGIYKQNLYLAEAAAQEAIQNIWNISRSDPVLLEKELRCGSTQSTWPTSTIGTMTGLTAMIRPWYHLRIRMRA